MDVNAAHRRENIILNAIDLIHEYGIHSVSTKEIAKRLGVSEGTIFKHFPKKSALLLAVLEHLCLYDNDMYYTAKNKKSNPKEAILFYINSYMIYYQNYPAITALLQVYDVLQGIPELGEKAKSIFFTRLGFMKDLIEEAQEAGEISRNIDSESLADIITSTCRGICLRWRLENFEFSLHEKVIQAVSTLLDTFSI
ncbi:TetR/AcrR family transcriptional regulator [Petroclostridium sp. X23]|uniref:TetR/AcrR family transcriptional regulator n=1 Tax=Petroclostridium sp. X23 TaxID=3045146 RepID=UPI0024AE3FDD|nr:TetR/AcrR family transcriptional regulator [Petroclostridium sp. X23]WHH60380.1 TetR/AcrR family transcriptional regulator [Petroclostridium sp. X23]